MTMMTAAREDKLRLYASLKRICEGYGDDGKALLGYIEEDLKEEAFSGQVTTTR